MKIINVEQGTQEWLEFRLDYVCASEIPTIMRGSPREYEKLLSQKINRQIVQFTNRHIERGHALEPVAKAWFEEQTGKAFSPLVGVSDEFPWLAASFDGCNVLSEEILEIKCPETVLDPLESNPRYEDYILQVQTQLIVSGASKAYLVAFSEDKKVWKEIYPDSVLQAEILLAAQTFYDFLRGERDFEFSQEERHDEAFLQIEQKFLRLREAKIQAEELFDEAKREYESCTGGLGVLGSYTQARVQERAGSIDWKSVPVELKAQLEVFRKPSISFYDIRLRGSR